MRRDIKTDQSANDALKTAVCVGNLTPHMYIPESNLESLA